MAYYFVDEKGRVTKKEKKKQPTYAVDLAGNVTKIEQEIDEELAPVKKSEKEEERTWFQAGAFEDGVDGVGDLVKKTGLTAFSTARDVGQNLWEGLLGIGEKTVDAGAFLVGGAGKILGADGFADSMEKFVEKDLINEEKIAKTIAGGWHNLLLPDDWDDDEYSLLGEKTDSLVQSAGQLAGQIGLQAVGVPWYLTTGATSFGDEAESALKQGASYGEAAISATISTAAEIMTEKLFGGSGLGEKGLIDTGALTKAITNKTVKALTDFGIDIAAEGSEEVVSQFVSTLGQQLTYEREETIAELLNNEEAMDAYIRQVGDSLFGEEARAAYGEAFIGGAALGGGMNTVNVARSIKNKTDYRSGLNANEEAVFNREYEARIAEEESGGKKLTAKKKAEIYDEVMDDLGRGRISTDTIESVLGGDTYKTFEENVKGFDENETYKAYMDAVNEEKAIRKEFEELQNMKAGEATIGQQDRYNELKARIEEFDTNPKSRELRAQLEPEIQRINAIKSQLQKEVAEKVKGDRLSESYRELVRSTEKFQADPEKYKNEHARKTIQNLIDGGIANNTQEFHEFADMLAKWSEDKGLEFDATDNEKLAGTRFAVQGATVNAFVTEDGKITFNVDSKKRLNSLAGHEITHVLEGTKFYDALAKAVKEYATTKGEWDSRLASVTELYKKYNPKADPVKELTADLVGDYIFTDKAFLETLSVKHRNIFQFLWDEINYMAKTATAGSKEARALLKAKKAFADAYRASGKVQAKAGQSAGAQYDISVLEDGKVYVRASRKVINGTTVAEQRADITRFFNDLLQEKPSLDIQTIEGDVLTITKADTADKARDNYKQEHGQRIQMTDEEFAVKLRAEAHIDELAETSKTFSQKPDEKNHAIAKDGFTYRRAYFEDFDGKYYEITLSIGNNGTVATVYNVRITKEGVPPSAKLIAVVGSKPLGGTPSANIIAENSEKSSGEAKNLSPEQEEFFKDSVVRDEDGKLKVMYHGTSKGGHTVFDTFGAANYGLFGTGSYFTDSKEIAESYTKKGKGKNPQVYETYLNITNPIDMDATADPAAWRNALPEVDFPESGTNEDFYRAMEEYFEDMEYPKWEAAQTAMEVIEGMGYDGITHIGGGRVNADGPRHQVYIAFTPEQIKAVDNEKPTGDADIRYSITEQETQESNKKLNEVGLEYDRQSETVSYSLSSLEDAFDYKTDGAGMLLTESNYFQAREEYVDALVKTTGKSREEANRYLDSLFLVHDMIAADRDRLDYEAAVDRSAWVSNTEYGGSIDFSTLCAKRRLFTGTFDAIQNALPDTVLNENDFLQIRDMLLKKGLESPCSMCYVEGSRARHGVYVEKWLKDYLKTDPEWKPQIADFTSTTRLEQTRIQHPEAYAAYQKAMNSLAQRKPKEASVRTDYKGEILVAFADGSSVEIKNQNGGIRFNSFSDFEIIHALDAMQVITDMARVGLNGQAYTKVKEFAEAFGNTGLKINLSLVAKDVDENGKLVFDETNGMNYAEAMDIRSRYSDNVGSVLVVFNDAQLKAALADGTIDYVLPFHRSQWKKSQYTMMGLPTQTKDYTMVQNDRATNPKTGKPAKLSKLKRTTTYTNDVTGQTYEIKDNIMPNQYWDFNKSGRENAQRYLDYINANEMTPKFDSVLEKVNGKWELPDGPIGDGYFKLLIDFKMYNNDGWGSPQMPVLPEFNMPYIQNMLKNYTGGHQAFPVAHDVVEEFVAGKKNGTFSLSGKGDTPERGGGYAVYGENVRVRNPAELGFAPLGEYVPPVQENIAPVREDVTPAADVATSPEDVDGYAHMTEESARQRDAELPLPGDTDVPPEMDAPYYGEDGEELEPADPFENRDMKEVGNRSVKAYMYENPEVKPFFQAEANVMLGELERTTKGERVVDAQVLYDTNGEAGVYGTKRHTSDDIAYLRDTLNYSYAEIEKGLKAIIEDDGKENNAVSKRIEFLLNDRLLNGYRDMDFGYEYPPNQGYVALLNEKQITEYNEEARARFFENADAYAPPAEDIAPVATPAAAPIEDIAPVREEYEAIRPQREADDAAYDIGPVTGERMVRVDSNNGRPGEKQRKWVRTSTGSDAVGGKILPDDLNQDTIHYQPISNKETLGKANTRLDGMGYEASVAYFNSKFADKTVALEDIALGERLIQEAVKRGDTKTAGELIQNVALLGTELGQKVQALSIIKRLTPEGQLGLLKKTIERGKTKGDKTFEGVELTQEMIDKILAAYGKDGTYDQAKLNKAVEDVKQQIADQMKVTRLEKVNAWRYLAMLGNPKTHIRNVVSNVAMRGTVAVKNVVARTIESVAPIGNRTKTWAPTTAEIKAFAKKTALEMKDVLSDDSKYNEAASIKEKRKIFKNKVLNAVYEFNSDMLTKEDWWFSRPAFENSLGEFLTANGIRTEADIQANPELVEKAKLYAAEQSQIATFRQVSFLAYKISELENKNTGWNIAVGSILPFKKTPINIAKAGLNYSPLGFVKTFTYDASKVKNGKMEASEMVDHLAQNVTGTALTLVGYLLASMGFLSGGGDDDKEGKYDYQLGEQAYSVNIGGKSYSLSWLSPVAMPLFVGANAYEQLVEGKEWNGDVVVETLAQTLDPLNEMSFLSGLTSVLSSYDSGMQKFAGIGETMIQNYATQFVPTALSQVATVMDDTKRTTKVDGDSDNKFVDGLINKLKYKIPGLRQTLEPSTDIWGNEVKQTENVLERAFETFIAPYAKRDNIATEIDAEIKELYRQTGDGGVIPSTPDNYVNFDGEKYKMSGKEYTAFKNTYGQTAYNLLRELMNTGVYKEAGADERAEMVNKVYDYARDEAKRMLLAERGVAYTNATADGVPYYREDSILGAIQNNMTPDEYSYFRENPEKYNFLKANNVSYAEYQTFDDDTKDAWTWAYNNPEGFTLSKAAAGDVITYRRYASELNEIKADQSADGKSITGSRKAKVVEYINGLDADYGEKLILFKSEYNADDTYNYEIVEYLNSREDLSYEDVETILKKLGFIVSADGDISW